MNEASRVEKVRVLLNFAAELCILTTLCELDMKSVFFNYNCGCDRVCFWWHFEQIYCHKDMLEGFS